MNQAARRTAKRDRFQPVGRWIRPWRRLAIYLRDGFRCVHCGKDLSRARPREVTLDHVVSRSRHRGAAGGPNRSSNLITSCAKCNERRGDKSLAKFHGSPRLRSVHRVQLQAARTIAPYVALAKALTSTKPWPVAHREARRHARKHR